MDCICIHGLDPRGSQRKLHPKVHFFYLTSQIYRIKLLLDDFFQCYYERIYIFSMCDLTEIKKFHLTEVQPFKLSFYYNLKNTRLKLSYVN